MTNTQFSSWPNFSQKEADKVSEVLLSNRVNYWTGSEGHLFEQEFADYCGVPYAIAVSNGTVALELALRALDVGEGDEVIVTPRTFIASVSCIIAVGAIPVFADIEPDSQNFTAQSIEKVISPQTKAVICVHLAGWPCDMDEILILASKNQLKIIEDCAQAHGAKYKGKVVGSIGDIGAFSFCQDKIITTGGEGGMLTIKDETLWKKIWAYKDHGKSWDAVHDDENSEGFLWLHESFGTNCRMTEIQSAIGRIQLKQLDEWKKLRTVNAHAIAKVCSQFECLRVPLPEKYIEHAFYKFYVFIKTNLLKKGWDRDKIVNKINKMGGVCYQGICPEVYQEKAFENTKYRLEERLPNAMKLADSSLMFLVHPTLTEDEMTRYCDIIKEVMQQASV
ncbi:MAG: DegT/DnrJ/EryC1/StrS aminotransferase family protein [Gammaproteobacteria bacterium]|nr:DegT/DnrJ/EryC1/StrS aminotransferase family protein [Gammaproteobacteria bacterium]